MTTANHTAAPSGATDAVLKPSDPVPADSQEVQGIDFNHYASRDISVAELLGGYASMGFQATAVGKAVRIINAMVSRFCHPHCALPAAACGDCACVGKYPCASVPKSETFSLIWPLDSPAYQDVLTGDSAHGKTRSQAREQQSSWDTRRI